MEVSYQAGRYQAGGSWVWNQKERVTSEFGTVVLF